MSTEPTTGAGRALVARTPGTDTAGPRVDIAESVARIENEAREQGAREERERLRQAVPPECHDPDCFDRDCPGLNCSRCDDILAVFDEPADAP